MAQERQDGETRLTDREAILAFQEKFQERLTDEWRAVYQRLNPDPKATVMRGGYYTPLDDEAINPENTTAARTRINSLSTKGDKVTFDCTTRWPSLGTQTRYVHTYGLLPGSEEPQTAYTQAIIGKDGGQEHFQSGKCAQLTPDDLKSMEAFIQERGSIGAGSAEEK